MNLAWIGPESLNVYVIPGMFFFSFPLSRIYQETWARALVKLLKKSSYRCSVFLHRKLAPYVFFFHALCWFVAFGYISFLADTESSFFSMAEFEFLLIMGRAHSLIDAVPYYWFFLLFLRLSPIQDKPNPISSWLNPIVFNKSLSCDFVITIGRVSPNVSNCCVTAGSKPVSLALFKINVLADTQLVFLFSSRPSQFSIWSFSTASDIVFKLIAF